MRIRDFRTIPLLAAVVGASIGAVLYFRTPALYASSSTIRVTGSDFLKPNSPSALAFRDTLSRAVPGADLRATQAVIHVEPNGASTLVRISHAAPDARQAQDIVKRLVAATVDGPGHVAARESVVVVVPPGLPTTPRRRSRRIHPGRRRARPRSRRSLRDRRPTYRRHRRSEVGAGPGRRAPPSQASIATASRRPTSCRSAGPSRRSPWSPWSASCHRRLPSASGPGWPCRSSCRRPSRCGHRRA